ncbi:hypothetical protein SASPL_134878 [Salvia splendens]|uniref:Glycosyl transferase family 1 domain-containing protein n=2 Tax=Salvia splendens TaxID=180675 RepID=A0A8X8WZ44_SALSN|nr:uncharacterized protein LOC121761258 isoform X1 [Salvia splendens]KAG6402676.1 hypothetical protein SASPL_134878 [Salvia splendens]
MGSLETGLVLKRDHNLQRSSSSRSSSSSNSFGFSGQRSRSRFARAVLFKKMDYLQLICSVAVFFFFVFFFQIFFLPGSVIEDGNNGRDLFGRNVGADSEGFSFLKGLDFDEDLNFEPLKIIEKFRKEGGVGNESGVVRFGYRKPRIALVFTDLWVDQHQILMATVATALMEIGYEIEVFTMENGPARAIWRNISVTVSTADNDMTFAVDWLDYDAVLVNSLNAAGFLSCLMQDPFKHVPVVWTIHEQALADQLRQYVSSGQSELIDMWRKYFSRATVVVFPNYILPIVYSMCDPGNYFVISGSPEEAWKADRQKALVKENIPPNVEYGPDDFVIAVVGSQLSYRGLWLEHAFVLKALYPLYKDFGDSSSRLKIIISTGDSTSNYSSIVETIALKFGFPKDTVKHVAVDQNIDTVIDTADLVVYGSFLEEHSFPGVLLKSMCFEKPIVAPDLPATRKYVSDKVNGYLFPKDNMRALIRILLQVVSNGKLSVSARNVASNGKHAAKNLMVSESVDGYASLLENILMLPSEVALPLAAKSIPNKLKTEWRWSLFEAISDIHSPSKDTVESVDKIEKLFDHATGENSVSLISPNETFLYSIWEEQKNMNIAYTRKNREDAELKDRTDQPRGKWDEIYRSVRRIDRTLHERDEGELERTGQPLCIYEPYFGAGTWPFLHRTSLYRGIGLSTRGRRPGADDVDGPSRLSLLNNAYYRDVLGEYGAFFAIANRIDRIHKNAWIGFQSWRATAHMVSMSKTAEKSLLDAVEARKHGDTLYFWARLDKDQRNPLKQDFWSFCDAINAGNCRSVFLETLKQMYGIKHNLTSLPVMPSSDGTWSVMHSWALPTKSFLEFVMFSRIFVDALDAQFHEDDQKTGLCSLGISKDKHCYSRLLELLVNVWAYHSARRMVYVDPETGFMQEQHGLKSRRGQMWIKWFQFSILKAMDEDLAEESDTDRSYRRRLWPSTGEIAWQGTYEKERNRKIREKEKKRQQSEAKRDRRNRRGSRQKPIGKYVKPVAEATKANATDFALR